MATKRVIYEFENVIEVEEYLDGRYGAPGEKRAEKKKATPEEIARVNQWNKEKKARHRLRMYFHVNDYFITLTYKKEARPPDMKTVKRHFRDFYTYLRKEYRKRGQELRWIRNIENTATDNWHIHVVVNRISDTDVILSKAWSHGKVRDKQLLYEKGEFRRLAQYITKDEKSQAKYLEEGILDHKITEASYSTSKNMPLPEPDVKKLDRWPKEPKVRKGFYLEKESYFEGKNKFTHYPYRHYTMIRIERRETDVSKNLHSDRGKRTANRKGKVCSNRSSTNKKRN